MDSGFLVDTSSGVLGGEDWALAVGGGTVRGTRSKGSKSMWWGEWLEEVETLQRERDGRDSLLLRGTIVNRTKYC